MTRSNDPLPERLGKYVVHGLLGSGGMGSVYLAEDPDIGRQVAIKIVTIGADADSRERFRREAQTLGRLNHPNIVTLLEYGDQAGQQYLVLEYLPGEDLSAWMRAPRSLREQLVVALDIARALASAHAQDVLHRDIKPANVRVLPDGHAKLMDFGIARGRDVTLTGAGLVVGTPEYLAPEVVLGEPASVHSDLHAFGVLLHNMLTGGNVFAGDSYPSTIARVIHVQPPPLSELLDGVPESLSALVARSLSKQPDQRPASAQAFVDLLDTLLSRTSPDQTLRRRTTPLTGTTPVAITAPNRRARLWARALPIAIAVGLLVAAIAWQFRDVPVGRDTDVVDASATPVETTAAITTEAADAPTPATAVGPEPDKRPDVVIPDVVTPAADAVREPQERETVAPAVHDEPRRPVAPPSESPKHTTDATSDRNPDAATSTPADVASNNTPAVELASPLPEAERPAVVMVPPPPTTPVLPPEPEIAQISPRVVRRGQTVRINVSGQHLAKVTGVEVLLGTGPDPRFAISKVTPISDQSLEFTIAVSRSMPLGHYLLVFVADNARSTPIPLEVSL